MTTSTDQEQRQRLDELGRSIAERVNAMLPQPPRFRYFTGSKNGHTYSWTVEPADEGKYWAQEFKPDGKGYHREVRRMGFKLRRQAKARALAWYQAGQPKPKVAREQARDDRNAADEFAETEEALS